MSCKRIEILKVPVDVIIPGQLNEIISELAEQNKFNQIVLLDFPTFMKARRNNDIRKMLYNSALIVPVSKRIISAAKFLKLDELHLYDPFSFVISILSILEKRGKTAYLLGSSPKIMQKAEVSLRTSFPSLRFVGRFAGKFASSQESNLILAIQKSSPTLLLAGKGLKGKNLWLYKRREKLFPGLALWGWNCYEVFGGKKNKPSYSDSSKFIKSFLKTLILPWRILLIFRQIWYWIILLTNRIFNKS